MICNLVFVRKTEFVARAHAADSQQVREKGADLGREKPLDLERIVHVDVAVLTLEVVYELVHRLDITQVCH